MASAPQAGRRSRWQRVFRFCRCSILGGILALVALYLYLDQAGVPDFLRARLQRELRARGVDVEFSRLRFRWYRGLVAESVQFRCGDQVEGPELHMDEMVLRLDPVALRQRQLQLRSIEVINGQFVLPVTSTNDPVEWVRWERIHAEVRFLSEDRWLLNRLTATFQGAQIHLSGVVTNASLIQSQRPFSAPSTASAPWRSPLRRLAQELRRMRFVEPPQVHLDVSGDARRPLEFTATVRFQARGVDTLWGTSRRLVAVARLNQATGTPGLGRSELNLEAYDAHTPWSDTDRVGLTLFWSQSPTNPVPSTIDGRLDLDGVYTAWGETPQLQFAVTGQPAADNPALLETEWRLTSGSLLTVRGSSATNELIAHLVHDDIHPVPRRGDWKLHAQDPSTSWGSARELRLTGTFTPQSDDAPRQATPDWGWWSALEPLRVTWQADLEDLQLTNAVFQKVQCSGSWDAPRLVVERLHGVLDGRRVELRGQVNIANRRVEADGQLALDVKRLASLLTPKTRDWLEDYDWVTPPSVRSRLWLTLPAWTNAHPDWRAEVQPTLGLDGSLEGTNGPYHFKGLPMDTVRFHFQHTNRVWLLTDFVATAPEGRLAFTYREDQRTRNYRFDLDAHLDPHVLRPLVPTNYHRAFALFAFREPPKICGFVQGRWRAPELTAFSGTIDARNFTFRGDDLRRLEARFAFGTNRWLTARDIRLDAGQGEVTAAGVDLNTTDGWLTLTDARSTVQPTRVTHAIGPQVEKTLSPYSFHRPPAAHVNGRINVRRTRDADLHIALDGGPFSWWRFQVPQIKGLLHWQGDSLSITNVEARFYQGNLDGHFDFDFAARHGAAFRFYAHLFNVNLHQMMADLWSPTNSLEGTLIADLEVTSANTDNWKSWQGFGRAELLDGYLWDLPLAGIFSDALNSVLPGVAKARFGGLTATYTITNSLIHTSDLALHSRAMRLAYRGTFDFDGNVDGRVEAQLLRELSGIGSIVRVVLFPVTKLFEYKVTGTLTHPEQEPLYIPKALLFPLNPFGTIRDLLTPDEAPAHHPVPKE